MHSALSAWRAARMRAERARLQFASAQQVCKSRAVSQWQEFVAFRRKQRKRIALAATHNEKRSRRKIFRIWSKKAEAQKADAEKKYTEEKKTADFAEKRLKQVEKNEKTKAALEETYTKREGQENDANKKTSLKIGKKFAKNLKGSMKNAANKKDAEAAGLYSEGKFAGEVHAFLQEQREEATELVVETLVETKKQRDEQVRGAAVETLLMEAKARAGETLAAAKNKNQQHKNRFRSAAAKSRNKVGVEGAPPASRD